MIAPWMIYTVGVTVLCGLAATALEPLGIRRRLQVRWLWLASLGGSFLIPSTALISAITQPAGPERSLAGDPTPAAIASVFRSADWWASVAGPLDAWSVPIATVWAATSLILLGLLLYGVVRFKSESAAWDQDSVAGSPVRLSQTFGPAAVGFAQPIIVLPSWVRQLPPFEQTVILSHEQSHVNARDPQVVTLATILCALVPWNLGLWWQLQRLRRAVELDCDLRLLRIGIAPQRYAEVLLDTASHAQSALLPAVALSRPAAILAERIGTMIHPRVHLRPSRTVAALVLAGCAVAIACEAPTPPTELDAAQSTLRLAVPNDGTTQGPLILVDGVRTTEISLRTSLPKESIASIEVLKGEAATNEYGEEGAAGVIRIYTKKESESR